MAGESQGMHSYGGTLFAAPYGTGNPAGSDPAANGYTQVAEVISVSGPGITSTVTRVTHLNSPGKAHEKVPGFMDGGQVTFRLNYTGAAVPGKLALGGLIGLLPQANDGPPDWGRYEWVVQLPDGGQWWLQGFVQGAPTELPEDDRVTVEVTVEVSGRPEFTGI